MKRATRLLDRALRPFSKVHPGEGLVAVLMLACVFLILTSYYVMKTAREGLILTGGTLGLRGDELKTYANGAMALLLVGLVPAYGLLANRMRRMRLITICYLLVIASLLVFFVLGRGGAPIGLAYFIWLGLVSVFLIALFWSYANDIYSEEQGKRLFSIIAVGGSLGAMLGPRVAKLADTFTLLPIAAGLLVAGLLLFHAIERVQRRVVRSHDHADVPITGAGGFRLVLRDRYLLLIACMLLVLNLINTTGEYILSNAVREHAMSVSTDPDVRRELVKAFYADFFSWVNLAAFVLQAFVVSRVIDKLGVRRALFVMPILVFGVYGAIGLAGGLALIRAAKLLDNSVDYSLQNTVRQSLFLPTSRAVKFKAKAAIDTFFVRAGDTLSAVLVGLWIHQLGLGGRELAFVNIALVVVWLAICVGIARHHRALSTLAEVSVEPPQRPLHGKLAAAASVVACVIALPASAAADESAPSREPADAPLPGEESGRTDAEDASPSTARRIGRTVLFVPRVALEVVFAPVRASIYATEKYDMIDRLYDLFFDDSHTYGIHPTLEVQSDFGATVGARAVHRDLFGAREQLSLAAAIGGRYRERLISKLRSGRRLDRVAIELAGELDRRPNEPFYGIGDGPGMETRYRRQLARAALRVDTELAAHLHAQLAGAFSDVAFERSENGPPIDEVHVLAGWGGYRQRYGELELRWDRRGALLPWDPPALHSTGMYAAAFVGRAAAAADGGGFWRAGFDVQHYWRIASGPRTLVTRLYGEGVQSEMAALPFAELPALGGNALLRGYPIDRFRGRAAVLGSLEYQWDLARRISASVFVDAGRVYQELDEIGVDPLRIGYGIGLQGHTSRTFVMRASIASSIDGGAFVYLAFDPVFDLRSRTERR